MQPLTYKLTNDPHGRTGYQYDVHGNLYYYGWLVTEPYNYCFKLNVLIYCHHHKKFMNKCIKNKLFGPVSKNYTTKVLEYAEELDELANLWLRRIQGKIPDVEDEQWTKEEQYYKKQLAKMLDLYKLAKSSKTADIIERPESYKEYAEKMNAEIAKLLTE